MAILFHCPWENADEWLAALRSAMPRDEIRVWPNVGDAEEIDFALVWQIPHGELGAFPGLLGISSLGAGVDGLLTDPELPANVQIARLVDPLMADRMAEYVCGNVLYYHLGHDRYAEQQRFGRWRRRPHVDARDRFIGLLGLGHLGRRCAERLGEFGFNLLGWSRGPKEIRGVHCLHGNDRLDEVLERAGILVVLLPLTIDTENLLDKVAFNVMPRGAYLINCSRGEIVDEEHLVAALDSERLAGATLDACREEPLPADHPLWKHPKIRITRHVASLSEPVTGALILAEQVRRARRRQRLVDVVEVARGY